MFEQDKTRAQRLNAVRPLVKFAMLFLLAACLVFILNGCVTEHANHGGASADVAIEVEESSDIQESEIRELGNVDEQLEADISEKIASMSLSEKISQMIIVRPEGVSGDDYSFTDAGSSNIAEYPFGGVCYFAKNIDTADGLRTSIEDFAEASSSSASKIPMFIAVDEEGGGMLYPGVEAGGVNSGIARLASSDLPGTTKLYPMFYYRDAGEQTAFDNAATIASYLSDYGFNWDFAPVADTNSNPDNPIIGVRAYSDDFQQTAALVSSAVEGFESMNMACALKHFPGHGDTKTDTHESSAVIDDKDYYALKSQELVPFIAGIEAGADSVMMGHITVTSVDDVPASMSRQWIEVVLRDELGFDGIVVTDGLDMGALINEYSNESIAVACVKAGNDILLLPNDPYAAVDSVIAAVESGEIPESEIDEHVTRILEMKAKHGIWQPTGNVDRK